jgi:Tfp pilus assembly protein PilF
MQNQRIEKLLAFLKDTPEDSFLRYALATEFVAAGDDDAALKYFEELLSQDPSYVATYYHLGKLLQRREEKERAASLFRTGMEEAKLKKDQHSLAELQTALTNLELGLDED